MESTCPKPVAKVENVSFSCKRRQSKNAQGIRRIDILGFYSMNKDFNYRNDLSQLRYLGFPRNPEVHFDLRRRSDQIIRKKLPTNEIKLDSALEWITSHHQECTDENNRFLGDFVTYRGVLTRIMCSPYEKFEGWIICASKFKGTIYLCKYDTPEKVAEEQSKPERQKEMGDWGYIFEQHLLSEHPGCPPNIHEPNNQNEEFSCVFRAKIGTYSLVFAAEMDGLEIRNPVNFEPIGNDSERLKKMLYSKEADFVELKTSANPTDNQREWQKIKRFKSLKWWAQSYLVGVDKIICGYRDNQGIVSRLDRYSVRELPNLGKGSWDPDVCLQYLSDFLSLVFNKVSAGCDELLWKFSWDPRKDPNCIEVELCENSSPYFFLHKWATEKLTPTKRKRDESSEDSEACSFKKSDCGQ
ncbi:decapping and exoribonuclease protein-like [Ischnura elegans]|uniref:decapping and exoribonuclease protein-like n=1 Tax=Ischnura elegans TaxID=197161 RepID=UPI001ED86BC6|nr:decapping and exoribonuclease protein-like [Ischnura elegans]